MASGSLRTKFNMAVVGACLLFALFFGVGFYMLEVNYYQASMREVRLLLSSVANQKRNDLANEIFARQHEALLASVEELLAIRNVVRVAVYDASGEPLAAMDDLNSAGWVAPAQDEDTAAPSATLPEQAARNATKPPNIPRDQLATDAFAEVRREDVPLAVYGAPIMALGERIGYLNIAYDLRDLQRRTRLTVIAFGVALAVVVASLILLLNVMLNRLVLKPLTHIRAAMNLVRDGRLGQQIRAIPNDELGDVATVFNDMSTQLEHKQLSLLASEGKYRSLFVNAVEGLFRSTMDGRILNANPAMARILGYASPDELIKEVRSMEARVFVDGPRRRELHAQLQDRGYVQDFEERARRKDGSIIWVSETIHLLRDRNGKALFLEGSFMDITERKRAESLEREKLQAQAANRAKTEFLAAMSHEIRTPMNAILGMTDLAMASGLNPQQWDYLQTVKDSAFHLLSVINDILDLSKIEAGRLELEPVDFDLHELIDSIAKSMGFQARKKGLGLFRTVDPMAPRYLKGDPNRLRQVILNLVGNAIKFTDHGRVILRVSLVNLAESTAEGEHVGCRLRFAVRDTGIGVPPEKKQAIFESFTQAEGSITTRKYGGTGLGLTISRQLVTLMGGDISLESEEGAGSVFSFTADFEIGDVKAIEQEALPEVSQEDGRSLNILLVEDNPLNVKVSELHLKLMGHNVLVADNGRRAIEIMSSLPKNAFDLVLMDLEMPVMDGFEATRQIRSVADRGSDYSFGPNPHVPIIAMTAHALVDVKEKCIAAGMQGFMTKPVNFDELRVAIQSVVAQEGQESSPVPLSSQRRRPPVKGPRSWIADTEEASPTPRPPHPAAHGDPLGDTHSATHGTPHDAPPRDATERGGSLAPDLQETQVIPPHAWNDEAPMAPEAETQYLSDEPTPAPPAEPALRTQARQAEHGDAAPAPAKRSRHAAAEHPPLLDTAAAKQQLGIEGPIFETIFTKSLEELRVLLQRIEGAVASGDMESAALNAHTAKSTAATMGAMAYREEAILLERAARAHKLHSVSAQLESMQRAMAQLERAVRERAA